MLLTYPEMKRRFDILSALSDLVLPRRISVAISKNLTSLQKELEIYIKQDIDIANRYAVKDENGKFVLTEKNEHTFETEEDRKGFLSEREELNNVEIDVDVMTFDAEALATCDISERYDILTPRQEIAIDWMVDYGE
jgi:hypothetical protein